MEGLSLGCLHWVFEPDRPETEYYTMKPQQECNLRCCRAPAAVEKPRQFCAERFIDPALQTLTPKPETVCRAKDRVSRSIEANTWIGDFSHLSVYTRPDSGTYAYLISCLQSLHE